MENQNYHEKAKQLMSEMNLDEKVSFVSGKDMWKTASSERLGINSAWMSDGPMGLRKADPSFKDDPMGMNHSISSVSFPSSALTTSSFDRSIINELGKRLGEEAYSQGVGLLLGPGVNMKRSPLAGRNFEYLSEDPLLAGELATQYVIGAQSTGPGVVVKHFAANNRENQRFTNSSEIDERTLREIYLRQFEMIVKNAKPSGLMVAYNKVNGSQMANNKRLLTDILRNEWMFDGLVMSDWGAVKDTVASLKAGLNIEMPGNGDNTSNTVIGALEVEQLSNEELDKAVEDVVAYLLKWNDIQKEKGNPTPYDKDEHRNFSRKIASESMILLKNENNVLPLSKYEKVLFVGELVDNPRYQGGGSSKVNPYKVVTPLEELKNRKLNYIYNQGYVLDDEIGNQKLEDEVLASAKNVDKVVFFSGLPAEKESEGYDKTDLKLPENQNELIKKIFEVNPNITIVMETGSAVETPWRTFIPSILLTYLPGETVGESTLDVLYGDVNPSGKLAETFPIRLEDTPAYQTFDKNPDKEIYHEGLFIGYRFYDSRKASVAFEFGRGLSYTDFSYSNLSVIDSNKTLKITFDVTNTGSVSGKEAPQLYIQNNSSKVEMPIHELRGFEKIELEPKETKTVTFNINSENISWYNSEIASWQQDDGEYIIEIGSSSKDIRLKEKIDIIWKDDHLSSVGPDTYISDIFNEPKLQSVLEKYGLKSYIESAKDPRTQKLFANQPLRTASMIGIDQSKVPYLIEDANNALKN